MAARVPGKRRRAPPRSARPSSSSTATGDPSPSRRSSGTANPRTSGMPVAAPMSLRRKVGPKRRRPPRPTTQTRPGDRARSGRRSSPAARPGPSLRRCRSPVAMAQPGRPTGLTVPAQTVAAVRNHSTVRDAVARRTAIKRRRSRGSRLLGCGIVPSLRSNRRARVGGIVPAPIQALRRSGGQPVSSSAMPWTFPRAR